MSLPTLVKGWQFSTNNVIPPQGSATANAQRMWRLITTQLLAFGSGAPTCLGSSDHVTAALDNVNRWTTDGAIVAQSPGVAHSWIVFQMAAGFGTNVQFCIDLGYNSTVQPANLIMSVSAGFTGGTTTNRPTATDEVVCASNIGLVLNSNTQNVWHMWLSTDGSIFRLFNFNGNSQSAVMILEKPVSSSAGWSIPAIGAMSNDVSSYGNLFGNTNYNITGRGPSGTMLFGLTTESYGASALGQVMTAADGIDGGFPFTSIGIYSPTVGMTGEHGRLTDIWFGTTVANDGDTYPNDATKQFVTIGDIILPWDGSTLVTT